MPPDINNSYAARVSAYSGMFPSSKVGQNVLHVLCGLRAILHGALSGIFYDTCLHVLLRIFHDLIFVYKP